MKKSFLAMLLMFVLVLPILATSKGSKELDLKAGALISPTLTGESEMGYEFNTSFTLAAEFFYFSKENLGLGIGVNNLFDSSLKVHDSLKFGATNIYLGVKPVLPVEGFLDDVYFLGQLGYGMVRMEDGGHDYEPDNGLYWAIGVGVEKQSFLVELLYSVNYTSSDYFYDNMSYSSLGVNVGYKFAL